MSFKKLRKNLFFRTLSIYMALTMMFPSSIITSSYALTGGPSQPEFNSFTPISTSDMVNLSSGDFNYNIPIMDVGGYPINLAYDSGVTADQEASWVGLGWNLNVGQINRSVRGLPDDFDGDKMTYKNNLRKNITVGTYFGIGASAFGIGEVGAKANVGVGVQYNTYNGITFKPSMGITFELSDAISVGANLTSTAADGATISPSVSVSNKYHDLDNTITKGTVGASINSRQGLVSLSLSSSMERDKFLTRKVVEQNGAESYEFKTIRSSYGGGFGIPMNDNVLFTPTKRVGMKTGNFSFNMATGLSFFGMNGQGKVNGFGSYQKISNSERDKEVKAYGYEFTEHGEIDKKKGILDFNREKDHIFSKNTTILPITNYTYDKYIINGQGINGGFRPYRSQVGAVYEPYVEDSGVGGSFGLEAEFGWNFATGVDIEVNTSKSYTGIWESRNKALNSFANHPGQNLDYEKVYLRTEGELNVDTENNENGLFIEKLGASSPIRFNINGSKHKRGLENVYKRKDELTIPIPSDGLKRSNRLIRNQVIQKITQKEAVYDIFIMSNSSAKKHHTVGYKILQSSGATYIYGKALYNTKKIEKTFALRQNATSDCSKGLVQYSSGDNDVNRNENGVDHFFNSVETPPFAHTYLLTGIISRDYVDLTNDGMTDDDLGSYTKIEYDKDYDYKWRVPFQKNMASFNQGFLSHNNDQKGHYLYGERKQTYVKKIETKTHVAVFYISKRKDAYGVKDENGGKGESSVSKKLDKIELFSKNDLSTPIKTAYFEYDYSLAEGVPNSFSAKKGKLTLKKVYFTYQHSKMGKYTPYTFEYGQIFTENTDTHSLEINDISNPDYNLKAYDIWGNYKSNEGNSCTVDGSPTTAEFPYVEQDKQKADKNVTAWTLTTINLPSGGKIEEQYESDEYQYVQNKRVMQLFEVTGVGNTGDGNTPSSDEINNTSLFKSNEEYKYLYVKIPDSNYSVNDFLEGIKDDYIYFKFLLQMNINHDWQYDYVSGYFKIDKNKSVGIHSIGGKSYLSIPMEFLNMEGGWFDSNRQVNPISKAGWYFGRQNMNRIVYTQGGDYSNKTFVKIVKDLLGSLKGALEIFKGPNKVLRDKNCANQFKPQKSWIRLLNPSKRKLGGGIRVKKIQMHDNWDVMTAHLDNPLYKQFYGQEYSYNNEDGTTSGVATFEPNGSYENPFVMPFHDKGEYLVAPKEMNYIEKPIGESFFPGATVTYGRVTVKNLSRDEISKHATGHIVNNFYTSYDFPTITDYTDLNHEYDGFGKLRGLLKINVKTHLTMAQGFVVEINNMNGKQKSQWIYAENQEAPLSGVEYEYSVNSDNPKQLNNTLPIIDHNGKISKKSIGVNYDVINDFRENVSIEKTYGVNTNLAGFLVAIWPALIPVPLPKYAKHENVLRAATTTKVVQRHGIMIKKTVYDLNAHVSTENLAWDEMSGQVLVTKTVNEFNDAYYSLSYPAYWHSAYDGMNAASKNLGLEGYLIPISGTRKFKLANAVASENLIHAGDELLMKITNPFGNDEIHKFWVIGDINPQADNITLMRREGKIVNDCQEEGIIISNPEHFKIVRSGYRNLQSASMASITTMTNPITKDNGELRNVLPDFNSYNAQKDRIINASAIEYSDFWLSQCESKLPYFKVNDKIYNDDSNMVAEDDLLEVLDKYNVNPYVFNIRGQWRAKRSYAYLTNRASGNINPRISGYFTSYKPFYKLSDNWAIDRNQWTFASQVTQFNPYGVEIENRDALGRYSSAQYGYKYTLPTAVASNAEYREMGFDGFEDYNANPTSDINAHFNYQDVVHNNKLANITTEQSHTGRKSIEVKAGGIVQLQKQLENCNPLEVQDCQNDTIDCSECLPDYKVYHVCANSTATLFSIPLEQCDGSTVTTTGDAFFAKPNTIYYTAEDPDDEVKYFDVKIFDQNGNVVCEGTYGVVVEQCK